MVVIPVEIYTGENESIGRWGEAYKNTGDRMLFWQSTDNLILVYTEKS